MNTAPDPNDPILQVHVEQGGLWVVRSTSATVYWLALDARLLLRAPGTRTGSGSGSSTGPFDGCWVPIVGIEAPGSADLEPGERWAPVRVGHRHLYHLDPHPDDPASPVRWWMQREVTTIEPVPLSERPAGRNPLPDEDQIPYR